MSKSTAFPGLFPADSFYKGNSTKEKFLQSNCDSQAEVRSLTRVLKYQAGV